MSGDQGHHRSRSSSDNDDSHRRKRLRRESSDRETSTQVRSGSSSQSSREGQGRSSSSREKDEENSSRGSVENDSPGSSGRDRERYSSSSRDRERYSSSGRDKERHGSSRRDQERHSSSRRDQERHSSSRRDQERHSSSRRDQERHSSSRRDRDGKGSTPNARDRASTSNSSLESRPGPSSVRGREHSRTDSQNHRDRANSKSPRREESQSQTQSTEPLARRNSIGNGNRVPDLTVQNRLLALSKLQAPGGNENGMFSGVGHRDGGGERGRGGGGRDRGRGRGCGSRGRGRGRGRGGRGRGRGGNRMSDAQQLEQELQIEKSKFDNVCTIPENCSTKSGQSGVLIPMAANFFKVNTTRDWVLYNYSVKFTPELQLTVYKKAAVLKVATLLGAHLFDGSNMYCVEALDQNPWNLEALIRKGGKDETISMEFKLVGQVTRGDTQYLQMYNLIMRKCFECLNFTEVGRQFYDSESKLEMSDIRLALWPGFKTVMRQYDGGLMMCCEVIHKVLRLDTCLTIIRDCRNDRERIKKLLLGQVVMTFYNKKTYKIDDIDFVQNPTSPMSKNGPEKSYLQYYQEQYGLTVSDLGQPLLVSLPKKKDLHRGSTAPIKLIPEFCNMTGLSDDLRKNFTTMRLLSDVMQQSPRQRVPKIQSFLQRLNSSPPVQGLMREWGINISPSVVEFQGRIAKDDELNFGNERVKVKDDWTEHLKSKPSMFKTVPLARWVVIVQDRNIGNIETLINMIISVGATLNFTIKRPLEIIRVPSDSNLTMGFIFAINQGIANHKDLQMAFIILPDENRDKYAAIKQRCVVDHGLQSQCFLAKHLNPSKDKSLKSVVSKVVIQMNSKLGGEPWIANNPLRKWKTMVVGFDVFHCGKRKENSIGAMVCSTNVNFSTYYSTISPHKNKDTLSTNMCVDLTKCIKAFEDKNQSYPDRIFMYRDGVGEGQLEYVHKTELSQIKESLKTMYQDQGKTPPMLSFIVVTKKSNSRFFLRTPNGYENPKSGTIVDNTITLPERYDFYLVAQGNRQQGTVCPTTFNVIHDTQGLSPDQIQILTYRFCHLYYNWSGTVAVPAVCQYSKKLSSLAGKALGSNPFPNEKISHSLYFL